jgi:hypothetical protein
MNKKLFLIDTATHVVVPREPDESMLEEAIIETVHSHVPSLCDIYKTMIAAAPEVESLDGD